MVSYRKTIKSKLLEYGGFREIIRKNGVLTIIDSVISGFLNSMSKRFYQPNGACYGLPEAFFRSRDIDRWSRYAHIMNEFRKTNGQEFSVLDVGSGGPGIHIFLSSLKSSHVFLLDIQREVLKGLKGVHRVVGDGCRLPFKDKTFDIVVSVDTAEHVARSIRHSFYGELKRVHKEKIIITCPMQSDDCLFDGKTYDILFQHYYKEKRGIEEPNTAQHIASSHPTVSEIKKEFPNSTIRGYKNCDVWLKYMLFSGKPFIGLFTGLLYYLFWRKDDNKPPYWGAIVVSN